MSIQFIGDELIVNNTSTGEGFIVGESLATLSDGRFLVTWTTLDAATDSHEIRGRILNSDGTPVGSDFLINSTTEGYQGDPSVTALEDGRFAVAWLSNEATETIIGGNI